MIILKLLSTTCVLGSLVLLVEWTVRASSAAYFKGQSVAREPNFSPPAEMKQLPLLSTAAKHALPFLPLVRKWQAKNKFGASETLQGFERQLIEGGIQHLITAEQFYAATILSG